MTVSAGEVGRVAVTDEEELEHAIVYRPEEDQWIRKWTFKDKVRLGLAEQFQQKHRMEVEPVAQATKRLKLRKQTLEALKMPVNLES